jgi:hypothetical protein
VKKQCSYLELGLSGEGYEIYRCGRYDFIKKQPGNEWVPAFGAGCCMSLFNSNRSAIIKAMKTDKKVIEILKM